LRRAKLFAGVPMTNANNSPPGLPLGGGDPPRLSPADAKPAFGSGIRTWFLTGVVVAGPLAVTVWLVIWFTGTVDAWVRPLVPPALWPDTYLPVRVPGTGVVLAFFGLTLLGFLTANLAGRSLIRFGERMLDRIPAVRGIYKGVKQVFETLFSQSGTSFRRVGLVEYPAQGMWSVVLISTPPIEELANAMPEKSDYISVFLPCAPNPTTGFWFYLPTKNIIEIQITPDEAFKLIMSAGVIQPGGDAHAKLAELASPKKGKGAALAN
jgi:uncharacterized membrane protein